MARAICISNKQCNATRNKNSKHGQNKYITTAKFKQWLLTIIKPVPTARSKFRTAKRTPIGETCLKFKNSPKIKRLKKRSNIVQHENAINMDMSTDGPPKLCGSFCEMLPPRHWSNHNLSKRTEDMLKTCYIPSTYEWSQIVWNAKIPITIRWPTFSWPNETPINQKPWWLQLNVAKERQNWQYTLQLEKKSHATRDDTRTHATLTHVRNVCFNWCTPATLQCVKKKQIFHW